MKRVEITTNGQVWLENQGTNWTLSTPWEIIGITSLEDLPRIASAIRYAMLRFEGETAVQAREAIAWVEPDIADDDMIEDDAS
jgi:hypothetical protein